MDIESAGLCRNEDIFHPIKIIDCDGDGNVFVDVDQKEFLEVVNRAGAWFIRVTDSSKISSGAPLEFTISKFEEKNIFIDTNIYLRCNLNSFG